MGGDSEPPPADSATSTDGHNLPVELQGLADALREEARRQVERAVDKHVARLQRWAQVSRHAAAASGADAGANTSDISAEPGGLAPCPRQSLPSSALAWELGQGRQQHQEAPEAVDAPGPRLAADAYSLQHVVEATTDSRDGAEQQLARHAWSAESSRTGLAVPRGSGGSSLKSDSDTSGKKPLKKQVTTMSLVPGRTTSHFEEKLAQEMSMADRSHATRLHMNNVHFPKLLRGGTADIRMWLQDRQSHFGRTSSVLWERPLEPAGSSRARKIVNRPLFDQTMGIILVLNAIVIGVQVDWLAREKTLHLPAGFRALDWIFCCIFIAELVLRFAAGPQGFCFGKDWRWNIFDTFVVLIQVLDEIYQLALDGAEDSNAAKQAMSHVSFARLLRLGRLARFLRMVRLVPGLKCMVYLLMDSMGSFFWAVVMLVFMMFCVAVYFTELYTQIAVAGNSPLEDMSVYWGSVPLSILSLFMAIFGGFDWKDGLESFRDIDEGMYVLNTMVFLAYIAFTTLVMLNLVTGVFVDGAQRVVKEDRDKELLRLAAKLFEAADQDGNHEISGGEFMQILESDLMANFCEVNGINVAEVDMLYEILNEGGDLEGRVSVIDIVRGCKLLMGQARAADMQTVKLMCKQNLDKTDEQIRILLRRVADIGDLLQQRLPRGGKQSTEDPNASGTAVVVSSYAIPVPGTPLHDQEEI